MSHEASARGRHPSEWWAVAVLAVSLALLAALFARAGVSAVVAALVLGSLIVALFALVGTRLAAQRLSRLRTGFPEAAIWPVAVVGLRQVAYLTPWRQ